MQHLIFFLVNLQDTLTVPPKPTAQTRADDHTEATADCWTWDHHHSLPPSFHVRPAESCTTFVQLERSSIKIKGEDTPLFQGCKLSSTHVCCFAADGCSKHTQGGGGICSAAEGAMHLSTFHWFKQNNSTAGKYVRTKNNAKMAF